MGRRQSFGGIRGGQPGKQVTGNQAACRRRWRCPDRHDPCSAAVRAAGITPCVLEKPPRPL